MPLDGTVSLINQFLRNPEVYKFMKSYKFHWQAFLSFVQGFFGKTKHLCPIAMCDQVNLSFSKVTKQKFLGSLFFDLSIGLITSETAPNC